mgnify:FL=1
MQEYVKKGGNLLVIGSEATVLFDDILGVQGVGERGASCLGFDNRFVDIQGKFREVRCEQGTEELAQLYQTNDFRFPSGSAATIHKYGKGKVAGVYMNIGESYLSTTSPVFRDFLSELIGNLFPEPLVSVKGSHRVHVIPSEKDGRMLIQLVNTSGDHANRSVKGIDEIPELRDLNVVVRSEERPKKVLLQPDGRPLRFDYVDGKVTFVVPDLKIHDIVEIIK